MSLEDIDLTPRQLKLRYRAKIRKLRNHARDKQQNKCYYCGCEMVTPQNPHVHPDNACTAEHLIPVDKNGCPVDPKNIVAACRKCNMTKGNQYAAEDFLRHKQENIPLAQLPSYGV